MTANIRQISEAYQAGIAVGRAAVKHEMDELAKLTAAIESSVGPFVGTSTRGPEMDVTMKASDFGFGTGLRKRARKAAPMAAKVPAETKGPLSASKARKAGAPREKGVKGKIVGLIAARRMSIEDIIAATGFKESSVRGTLQGLKKKGLASQEADKAWIAHGGGNSEGESGRVEIHDYRASATQR